MSSNAERVPNTGAQAMAEEALLKEIGCRSPSPTQAVKVCQILGIATRENIRCVREIAKNKNEIASEAETEVKKKNQEGKKMEVIRGNAYFYGEVSKKMKAPLRWLEEKITEEMAQRKALQSFTIGGYTRNVRVDVDTRGVSIVFYVEPRRYEDPMGINKTLLSARLSYYGNPEVELERWQKDGWPPLGIEITDKKLFYLARSIGKAYEEKVQRNCVTIIRNYKLVG